MKKDKILLCTFLVLFVSVQLYLGPGNVLDNKLQHESPYGYMAADAFWHEHFSESVLTLGHYKLYQPSMVADLTDVIATNPPALPHLVAGLSSISGLESYDAQIMVVFLIPLLSSLLIFLLIKRYDTKLAVLSVPLTLLLYSGKFLNVWTWGIWTFALSNLFLLAFFYSLIAFKKSYIIHGILIAAVLEAYTLSIIFLVGFVAIKFYENRKTAKEFITHNIKSFLLAIIISCYYLFIFYFSLYKKMAGAYSKKVSPATYTAYRAVFLSDFRWLLVILGLGLLCYILFTKNKLRDDFILGFYAFLLGFMYLIIFGKASITIRFFWPLYFAVFFGLSFKCLLKFLKADDIVVYGVGITFLLFLAWQLFTPIISPGIMTPQEWKSYGWIQSNVKDDETLLYFFSTSYMQSSKLVHGGTVPYFVVFDDIKSYIADNKYPKQVRTTIAMDGIGKQPYKTSLFTFGYHMEDLGDAFYNPVKNICDFDFIVFNIQNYDIKISEYNVGFLNHLLQNNNSLVFQDQPVFIVKITEQWCDDEENN